MIDKLVDYLGEHPAYFLAAAPELATFMALGEAVTPETKAFFGIIAIIIPLLAKGFDILHLPKPRS